jgi:hypothetical protein
MINLKVLLTIFFVCFNVVYALAKEYVYISRIQYFTSDEVFIPIPVEKLSESKKKALLTSCDSIISDKEMDVQRRFVPYQNLEKYMKINKSESILIYNDAHQLIGQGNFNHFEYLETFDGEFVACYRLLSPLPALAGNLYCISENMQQLKHKKFDKALLPKENQKARVAQYLKVKEDSIEAFATSEMLVLPADTFSFLLASYQVLISDEIKYKSVVLKANRDRITLFYQQTDEKQLTEILATPWFIEGKPIFLVRYEFPGTDNWGYFALYSKKGKLSAGNQFIEIVKK